MKALLDILNPYRWLLLAGLLATLYGAHLWRVGAAAKAAEKAAHGHYAGVLAGIAAKTAAAEKAFRVAENKARSAIEKEANDGQAKIDLARADARRADAAAAGLRQQLAHYRRAAARAAARPGAAPAGPPAADALDLLAQLFGRADDRAGELAAFADLAHAAGRTCERAYDAIERELNERNPER
jgi:hypothetical protein